MASAGMIRVDTTLSRARAARIQNTTIGPNSKALPAARPRHCVAGVIEAFVASDAAGERLRAERAQGDRGDRRGEHGAGNVGRGLGGGHGEEAAEEREEQTAEGDHGGSDDHYGALAVRAVDEGAGGGLGRDADQT